MLQMSQAYCLGVAASICNALAYRIDRIAPPIVRPYLCQRIERTSALCIADNGTFLHWCQVGNGMLWLLSLSNWFTGLNRFVKPSLVTGLLV